MYCPNCNNFVDDNREQCPFCNTQIHSIVRVNTNERQVMEKVVGSKLYVVMAVAFTLYTVFTAMSAVLNVFSGAGFDIFKILLTIFGGILTWRIWTLYMGTVKKAPEDPRAEKMTAFFTCQKVFSIIMAVLLALGSLGMLILVPYAQMLGDVMDKVIYEDGTLYDVILAVTEDEEYAQESYDEFLLMSGVSEDELNEAFDSLREAYAEDENVPSFIKNVSFGYIFKIGVFVMTVLMVLGTVTYILFAFYMSQAVCFWNDFGITWNGLAPWRRGAGYAAGLGYFLSVILFLVALCGIFTIPQDISLLTNLAASVAMFCFARFTSKIQKYMDELYRLNI